MKKLIRSKKGFTVQDMLPLAMVLVVAAIGIGIGAEVLGSIRDQNIDGTVDGCNATGHRSCSYDVNATLDGLDGIDTFSEYIPTIALVVVAAIVIGVLVVYLAKRLT